MENWKNVLGIQFYESALVFLVVEINRSRIIPLFYSMKNNIGYFTYILAAGLEILYP